MKIVYIGIVDFSYHCLSEVLKNKGNIIGIVTSKNDANNSDFRDLSPIARQHGIPIHYCKNVNSPETIKWIKDKNPDIIFCWGWSQLIKTDLLYLTAMGIVGVHPALLPENRGRHPLIWALVLGLKESGLTFFFMDKGADSGPILSQKRFEISDADTAGTLYKKIKDLATIQIADFLLRLISHNHKPIIQKADNPNYWRKRSAADGRIDWRMSETAILNLIRALTYPYPGAQFKYNETMITVWEAYKYKKEIPSNIEPGKIIRVIEGKPIIKCFDGAIAINSYEPNIAFIGGEYINWTY